MSESKDPLAERGRYMRQTYRELVDLLPRFQQALAKLSLSIRSASPLDRLLGELVALSNRWDQEGNAPHREDRRADIAKCASMADLMLKVIAVSDFDEFYKLRPHLELLLGDEPFVQHYFTPQHEGNPNKVFELYLGCLTLFVTKTVEMDDPHRSSGGTNPDIMSRFSNKRWGIACKVLHGTHPGGYYEHLEKAIDQIEKSGAERGIVMVGVKNLLPFDQLWPIAERTDREVRYHYHATHEEPFQKVQEWVTGTFYQPVIDHAGGVKAMADLFAGKAASPVVIHFAPIITGCMRGEDEAYTKLNIFKKLKFAPPQAGDEELPKRISWAANNGADHAVRSSS
jgi:hypothetical protein